MAEGVGRIGGGWGWGEMAEGSGAEFLSGTMQGIVAEQEAVLQQLKKELEGLEAEETGVQEEMMDLKHELEKHSTKLKDSQQKIKYYQTEVTTHC